MKIMHALSFRRGLASMIGECVHTMVKKDALEELATSGDPE